ncbi:Proteasome, subunit alpha/beta domain-containing protein [Rozella allomycis CSF55]|uniref:Proteasome, subunit alpha/beta domain-containing protein n=1 Tax=Rozella allomycis (strain CSF55) TaxID=988480 RepID=A0A075AU09_ROZAC|nr:Proteasome, subunit alpha/beta domain-containing protein [Rozella allomycis CSF55]|eukprot:EPZ32200.1 Proteasome, subunit alpha/beta domain-containing protein [Rozella allomycis CSF55]
MEAVKQGSPSVALRSSTHAVLLAIKRSQAELAAYQKKIFKVDDHIGIAIAGLTSDARVLSTIMRNQAIKSKLVYDRQLPVQRIVAEISDRAQRNTQLYGGRPYGVGLLVAGVDENGAHIYEFSPSGNYFEYVAMAIGARAQSAKTYLEKQFEAFENASVDELVLHGLRALRDTLQQDKKLDMNNTSIAIIGVNQPFSFVEGAELEGYLQELEKDPKPLRRPAAAQDQEMVPAEGEQQAPMDVE